MRNAAQHNTKALLKVNTRVENPPLTYNPLSPHPCHQPSNLGQPLPKLHDLLPTPTHPSLPPRQLPLHQPNLLMLPVNPLLPTLLMHKIKTPIIRIRKPPPHNSRPQKRRMRYHDHHILGPLIQVGQRRPSARQHRRLGEPVGCAGGRGLVRVDGVEGGEIELGELGRELGGRGAGVAGFGVVFFSRLVSGLPLGGG